MEAEACEMYASALRTEYAARRTLKKSGAAADALVYTESLLERYRVQIVCKTMHKRAAKDWCKDTAWKQSRRSTWVALCYDSAVAV